MTRRELIRVPASEFSEVPTGTNLDEGTIEAFIGALEEDGRFNNPPLFAKWDGGWEIITGRHRWEALKRAGVTESECTVIHVSGPEEAARRAIQDNLLRKPTSVLEVAELCAKYVALRPERLSPQVGAKGRPEGGIALAARQLNIPNTNMGRLLKIATLTKEAKEEARRLGLTYNQSLLELAAKESSAAEQLAVLRRPKPAARARTARVSAVESVQVASPGSEGVQLDGAEVMNATCSGDGGCSFNNHRCAESSPHDEIQELIQAAIDFVERFGWAGVASAYAVLRPDDRERFLDDLELMRVKHLPAREPPPAALGQLFAPAATAPNFGATFASRHGGREAQSSLAAVPSAPDAGAPPGVKT